MRYCGSWLRIGVTDVMRPLGSKDHINMHFLLIFWQEMTSPFCHIVPECIASQQGTWGSVLLNSHEKHLTSGFSVPGNFPLKINSFSNNGLASQTMIWLEFQLVTGLTYRQAPSRLQCLVLSLTLWKDCYPSAHWSSPTSWTKKTAGQQRRRQTAILTLTLTEKYCFGGAYHCWEAYYFKSH